MPIILGCDVRNQDPQTGISEKTRTVGQRVMMSMGHAQEQVSYEKLRVRSNDTAINLKLAKSFNVRT